MPCKKYKSKKQRNLCFATEGWTNWKNIKKPLSSKLNKKTNKK